MSYSSDDPRNWMWAEACALLERAERLHRQFFEPRLSAAGGTGWEPPVDIFETERELWVVTALPGVAPEDLEVYVEANTLVITGRRRLPAAMRGAILHRLEIPHGRFERRIGLPAARLQLGRRELTHGCLILVLLKTF